MKDFNVNKLDTGDFNINELLDNEKKSTRQIAKPEIPCMHPGHQVPGFQVFPAGTHEHTCPSCGNVIVFTVPLIWC